ncbi:464_t:CDS:2 [Funneliformis caledonium]|uniref:464_t:CDS:1 n=1 Tax=Funneliformis caledonium TaxID=1117310 RepID=A0A9N9CPH4_9GLOM|nr:464_t:CDS:2 [Funneliformis caledonium]
MEDSTIVLTPTAISSMKRSELQKLCKKYGLKANGKNTDLQKKLRQYALNSERSDNDMEDILMTNVDHISDLRNQYAVSVSEPVTPQTPSAIPLEQQNKIRRSLVEDTPTNIKSTYQHEIKRIEVESVVHDYKTPIKLSSKPTRHWNSTSAPEPCLSLILYNKPKFPYFAKEQEVTDTNNVTRDGTLEVAEKQNTDQLVLDGKDNSNTIVFQHQSPVIEALEINQPSIMNTETNIFTSPLNRSCDLTPTVPQTPPAKHTRSVETERASTNLMARLIATPIRKSGVQANSLTANRVPIHTPKTEAGPALDKNSPFVTAETKLNFESILHNVYSIQESDEDIDNQGDPMEICDERPKSTEVVDEIVNETVDVPLVNGENTVNITASIYEEMEKRVDQLRALPSPERKKILETDDAKTEIHTKSPFKNDSVTSLVKPTPSSINRFNQLHEKVFSKMPSIATHYSAQKTTNVEETQKEVNKKRKIPDVVHSPLKKQKLVEKPVTKRTYDKNRTILNNRSSMRLISTKDKSVSQTEVQPNARSIRTSSRLDARKSLKKTSYTPHKGPVKSIIPNPGEQKMKEREEFERRKQAARNVAQPVLEKMKNRRKTKENVEKVVQSIQGVVSDKVEKKSSSLPKKVTTLGLRQQSQKKSQ